MKNKPDQKNTLETLKLTITALDEEGVGIAHSDRHIVLVPGALPTETVIAAVEHVGRTHIYTHLQKILRRAPERTAREACSIAMSCQSCPLICLNYPAQLNFKRQRVVDALTRHLPDAGITVDPVLPAPEPFGYRTSAKLVIARKRETVQLGLYRRGSHEVINCPDCPVHHPLINRIAAVVRDYIQRQGVSVYSSRHQRGLLRYLLVRVSPTSNRALVTLVGSYRDYQTLPKLAKKLTKTIPEVVGVHHNINSSTGNSILGNETIKLLGFPDLIEQVGDIRLQIAPESFFQVNTLQAAQLYRLIGEWAAPTHADCAVDLFCGIGGIALHLARSVGKVIGVEVVPEAVRNAIANARLNNLTNCTFIAGDAAEELQRLDATLRPKPTLVTVNPPRKGCGPELLQHLAALKPRRIIYTSCDPDTLAGDIKHLATAGYRLARMQPLDMFPQTAHVETVALLTTDTPENRY